MAENRNQHFLGRGFRFPPRFPDPGRGAAMAEGEEDIRQSLRILLATNPGERLMHPTFGCGIREFVFDGLDVSLRTEIADTIEKAVLFFEPRIALEQIDVGVEDALEGRLRVTLDYRIRETNTRSNLVFPFYLREGTNLPIDAGTGEA